MPTAHDFSRANTKNSDDMSTDDLKAELQSLRDDLKSLIATAQGVAKSKTEDGIDRGREAVGEATESAYEARDLAQNAVRQNPLMALGLAAGVGALIATLRK